MNTDTDDTDNIRVPDLVHNEQLIDENEDDPQLQRIIIESYNEYHGINSKLSGKTNTKLQNERLYKQLQEEKLNKLKLESYNTEIRRTQQLIEHKKYLLEQQAAKLKQQEQEDQQNIEIRTQYVRKIIEWIMNTHPHDNSPNSLYYDNLLNAFNDYIQLNNYISKKYYVFMINMKINPKLLLILDNLLCD